MRISDWSSDVCSSDLKLNYLRSLDDERDYTSYRGALRGFYRMSPLINLYVQGYVNRRDFLKHLLGTAHGVQGKDLGEMGAQKPRDRKSGGSGKRVAVRVDLGGRGIIKKKKNEK